MTAKRYRVRGCAAVAGLVAAAILAVGPPARASADTGCSNFLAVAASQGVQGEVDHSGLLLDEEDVDAPEAQAAVDSLGDSSGYAAGAYPGTSVVTALGLTPVPESDYPALAQSSYPTKPHDGVSAPGVSITADSQSLLSSANATSQGGSGTTASIGSVVTSALAQCAGDGTVSANATSDGRAVSFGDGVLSIGVVHSAAKAVTGADGKDVLSAELDAGHITVGGQNAELTPAGLAAAGSSVALPSAQPINQELSAAGISVRYLAAARDPDGNGIVAPGIAVILTHQGYGTQPTDTTYVFGQSYARAQSGVVAGGFAGSGASSVSTLGTGQSGSSVAAGGPTPAAGMSGPAGQAATPAVGNLSSAPAAAPATPSDASTASGPTAQQRVLAAGVDASALSLYAMVVLGGLVVIGAMVLFKFIGMRFKWI